MKNAPAVTARRATNQIVLVAEHQALAVIEVVILAATAVAALAVIVVAEQVVRVAIMLRIGLDAMVRPARLARLTTVPIPRGLHAMETAHILLDPRAMVTRVLVVTVTTAPVFPAVTAIPVRPEPVAVTAPTVRVRVVTAIRVHVATATSGRATHVAIAILLVALREREETAPIRRARRVMVRAQTVLEATVQTVRVPIVQTDRVPIVPTAISREESGSPMEESVVRSARR